MIPKTPFSDANRLPVTHPEYRYPPSRNPYWKKVPLLAKRLYADNDAEKQRGSWLPSAFPSPQAGPLHVELGANAGHVVVEWAARDPAAAYIGLDWKIKAAVRAAEKGAKRQLPNLTFIRANAARLKYIFAPGEIDFLYLFFPDPWAKKAQLKHRFVTPENLREIAHLLKPGSVFHIKTDHADYFEWMVAAIAEVEKEGVLESFELTRDLHAGHRAPETLEIPDVTLFEKLFIKDGIPIKSVKLRKPSKL
jgi:tRNA (guanine-N7-)-methyltransferase